LTRPSSSLHKLLNRVFIVRDRIRVVVPREPLIPARDVTKTQPFDLMNTRRNLIFRVLDESMAQMAASEELQEVLHSRMHNAKRRRLVPPNPYTCLMAL
jgi:hypothetical protein